MQHELKNRDFYKKTLYIMAPVVLQQLITIGVNFFDNMMVGGFGEAQISAAAFSNQFYSFFQFICMGLGSGAVVMSSQFWGHRELEPMKEVVSIAMRLTLGICLCFSATAALVPAGVLGIFTNDSLVIQTGTPYLRTIAVTFLFSGLSSTTTYILRSIEEVRVPLLGSAGAFCLNIFFNWVFIFGKLGAPRLELLGAAVGTVIARTFEFCFIVGYFLFRDKKISFRIRDLNRGRSGMFRKYVYYSIPVLCSDTLLGLSLSLSTVILGHTGREVSSAHAIVNSFVQMTTVLNMGMSGASAIIIGHSIGQGDIPRAKREGNTYVFISFVFGLAVIPLLLLIERPFIGLYNITKETLALTHGMMVFTCIVMPIQTIAYMTSKGILRGGGDTRFLLLADSSLVWFVSLPLGALAAFVWHMSPIWVYVFLRIEYPLKGIVCFIRFCSGKWISVINSDEAADALQ